MRREKVWLGGVELGDVDGRIINVRLLEPDPAQDMSYGQLAGRDGRLPLRRSRTGKTLRVEFMVRELYDLAARTAALDKVNDWARAGYLRSSTRPGREIYVIPTKYAAAANIREYTNAFSVELEAAGVPYWRDRVAQAVRLNGSTVTGTLRVGGNAETTVEGTITPTGGTLTALTVTAGSTSLALAGLSVAAGTAVTIFHDDQGILSIRAGDTSILSKRTAASDDELLATPGTAAVAVTANVAVSATLEARGRWL